MQKNKKILFISHDAKRTGAPILLQRLLVLLKQKENYEIEVLLKNGGNMVADFEQIFPTFVWNKEFRIQISDTLQHHFGRFFNHWKLKKHQIFLQKQLKEAKYDLVISNTITNGDLLPKLHFDCPCITFVHELGEAIKTFTQPHELQFVLENTDFFIFPSQTSRQYLIKTYDVPAEKTNIWWGLLPDVSNTIQAQEAIDFFDKKIKKNSFTAIAIGTADARKGVDIFLNIAQKMPDIQFIWIGGTAENELENVHFIASTPHVLSYLHRADVFLLTSREDPYPLVVLEAAQLQKPIICFDEAGGAKELVGDDAGYVVPFLDEHAMIEKLLFLKNNPEISQQLGNKGYEKVHERHNPTRILADFESVVERIIKG